VTITGASFKLDVFATTAYLRLRFKDVDAGTLALNRPGSFDCGPSISGPPSFSQPLGGTRAKIRVPSK
jgi:hypothetical protein